MSEERQYWPTDAHMAALRSEGKLPYSNYLALCVASLAAIASCYLFADRVKASGSMLINQLDKAELSPKDLSSVSSVLVELLLFPALVVGGAVLIAGILQNKFYFSSAAFKLDISRASPSFEQLSLKHLSLRALKLSLTFILLVATAGLVLLWGVSNLSPLLAAPLERVPFWTYRVVERISIWAGVFVFLSGGAGLLISRILFKLRHRMTRAELEQQLREGGN